MKKVKFLNRIVKCSLLGVLFAIAGCSDPDPCDAITCVNGSCDEGICNCDAGSYGPECNITDLIGYYFITSFDMESCPNYTVQYNIAAPASEGRVCGLNENDRELCFSNGLGLNEDGTTSWIRSVVLDNGDGTAETTFFEFKQGTYQAQGDDITITLDDGTVRNLKIGSDGSLIWTTMPDDGGQGCAIIEGYTQNI